MPLNSPIWPSGTATKASKIWYSKYNSDSVFTNRLDASMKFNLVQTLVFTLCLISVQIYGIQDASGKRIVSKYERIMQMYPQLSSGAGESSQWRAAEKDNMRHPCRRDCADNQPMTCYYYMVVHYDDTMAETCKRYLQSKFRFKLNGKEYVDGITLADQLAANDDCKYADGLESEVMVVNGQLPGMSIEVCHGDTVVADVINSMHETTTIHWHGMHQRLTPFMDGVPHVTQYPIEAGQAFRYRFEVDHGGTNWWHSHTEHQRAFGLAGPLVVRMPPKLNPHAHLYDFDMSEHVIMIQDWVHNFVESVAENILINGRGRNLKKGVKAAKPTLYAHFPVVRGGRYRFRVIFNVSITFHRRLQLPHQPEHRQPRPGSDRQRWQRHRARRGAADHVPRRGAL
ncbi:uncharacterized protein LOC108023348 isoform X3 [Drosophila biarmipes]|uniref:uncharacterized protein LOC108023348 isoform X3 n=1 Tax=Drosophila biarmipes TaxID=125945 RepID=UPI0021CC5B5B|nr:uncharacterized protein LOC108023348 isoform X3 [Drosophila biarmipes]